MTMTYWYVKSVKSIDCKSYSLKTLGFPHRFVRFEWVEFTGGSPHGGPGWTSSVYWLVDIPTSFLVGNIRSFCEGWMGESAFFWRKGWVGIYIYTQYPVHLEKGKREHVFTSLLLKYLLGNSNLIIPLSFMFPIRPICSSRDEGMIFFGDICNIPGAEHHLREVWVNSSYPAW